MINVYNDERITVEPAPVKSGGKLKISYHGLLKNDGADEVYLHYGLDGWKDISTVKMNLSPEGFFDTEIKAYADEEINFCFKDSAENWDNNSSRDWKCEVI